MLLIGKGADVNSQDHNGFTPLHRAAVYGNTEVSTVFLESGANIGIADRNGYTALKIAVRGGHTETAELLEAHGEIE